MDYALGANPNKRSYLVGFGNKRFAGPDHNDVSVCGKENRPYLPLGSVWKTFMPEVSRGRGDGRLIRSRGRVGISARAPTG